MNYIKIEANKNTYLVGYTQINAKYRIFTHFCPKKTQLYQNFGWKEEVRMDLEMFQKLFKLTLARYDGTQDFHLSEKLIEEHFEDSLDDHGDDCVDLGCAYKLVMKVAPKWSWCNDVDIKPEY